jgi:hypothetical protein
MPGRAGAAGAGCSSGRGGGGGVPCLRGAFSSWGSSKGGGAGSIARRLCWRGCLCRLRGACSTRRRLSGAWRLAPRRRAAAGALAAAAAAACHRPVLAAAGHSRTRQRLHGAPQPNQAAHGSACQQLQEHGRGAPRQRRLGTPTPHAHARMQARAHALAAPAAASSVQPCVLPASARHAERTRNGRPRSGCASRAAQRRDRISCGMSSYAWGPTCARVRRRVAVVCMRGAGWVVACPRPLP